MRKHPSISYVAFFLWILMLGVTSFLHAEDASPIALDCRDIILLNGNTYIASAANSDRAGTTLQADGTAAAGWSSSSPYWNTGGVGDGMHTLVLSDGDSASAEVLVLNDSSVVIHDGTLTEDDVWESGVVHVVRNWVRIPAGRSLVISNGAVVKFCEDTGLGVEGTLEAKGVIFTALADDTIGGDTDCGSEKTLPYGTYTVEGDGEILTDEYTEFRLYNEPPGWTAPTGMQNSMSVSVVVYHADGTKYESPGSLVGFFDQGGECRGVAVLRSTSWGALVYQGQLYGNESKESGWSIIVWDASENQTHTIYEKADFVQDGIWGTAREPQGLHGAHHIFLDGTDKGWFDYQQQVTISTAVPSRKIFEVWSASGITLSEAQKLNNPVTFVMPDNDVYLTSAFIYPNSFTWTLQNGWNWVSVNLEPNADISYVLRDYTPSDGDQVKSNDCYSRYYSKYGCWDPEIPIAAGKMYAVYRGNTNAASVDIHGDTLEADNYLSLHRGWNWIGCFTDAPSIGVKNLVHGGGFSDGDQLKGYASFVDYYLFDNWKGWDGELSEMTAGKGYKLKVANAGLLSVNRNPTRDTSLEAPVTRAAGRGSDVGISGPWAPPEGYAYTMTIEAMVREISGDYMTTPGSVVGVFDALGNCRGIASLRTTKWNTQVYGGQIMSDSIGETGLTLRFWDSGTGNIRAIQGTVSFAQDTNYGTAADPVTLTVTASAPGNSHVLTVNGKSASGYCTGDALRVTAPAPPAGQHFVKWNANGVKLSEANTSVQEFTMPDGDVTLTAVYESIGFQGPEGWTQPASSGLAMSLYGRVVLTTGEAVTEENSMVAAFDAAGNCRGVGIPDHEMSEQYGCAVYLLQVASDGQTSGLTLKFWSQSTGEVQDLEETLEVTPGAVVGTTRPLEWNVVYIEPDWRYAVMTLLPGWNTVSPTLKLSADSAKVLMGYAPMRVHGGNFVHATTDDLEPGTGIWIYNPGKNALDLSLKGEAVDGWHLELSSGWQFLGAVEDVSAKNLPEGIEAVWTWDPSEGYQRVVNLKAGKAYWLKK